MRHRDGCGHIADTPFAEQCIYTWWLVRSQYALYMKSSSRVKCNNNYAACKESLPEDYVKGMNGAVTIGIYRFGI